MISYTKNSTPDEKENRSEREYFSQRIYNAVSLSGFIVLAPCFALYQMALYMGVIPPFLGGYSGVMGVVVMMLMFPFVVMFFVRRAGVMNWNDFIFFAFVFISGIVSFYYLYDKTYFTNARSVLSGIPQVISYFFIYRMINLELRKTAFVMGVSLFVCGVVINFLGLGLFDSDTRQLILMDSYEESYANYQFFGMIYIFSFLSFLPLLRKFIIRLIIYISSYWILYENGARSEFFIAIISSILIEFYIFKSKIIIFSAISILTSFIIINIDSILLNINDNSRVSSILIGESGSDASVLERKYTIFNAINNIYKNPIFGRYGEYEPGLYAHNILSVWSDYGVFVFFIFLFGMILPLRNSIDILISKIRLNQFISTAIFSISGIILFVFSKFYIHPIFGVMLALSAQYSQFRRRSNGIRS